MKIEYTNRAVADLRKASADSRRTFGDRVAAELEARIREVVAHVAENPEATPQILARPGVRMVPLVRYPYNIFYRILQDRVRILHIRHTSRRPWIARR
jgi:plasmid stabilization system protein ParE